MGEKKFSESHRREFPKIGPKKAKNGHFWHIEASNLRNRKRISKNEFYAQKERKKIFRMAFEFCNFDHYKKNSGQVKSRFFQILGPFLTHFWEKFQNSIWPKFFLYKSKLKNLKAIRKRIKFSFDQKKISEKSKYTKNLGTFEFSKPLF